MQALDNRQKFAGAVASGWRAYNITGDRTAGIGAWSDDDLAQFLSTGHAQGRGIAAGPMGEAVDFSLRHLASSDIRAIVAYLRSVPAIATPGLPAPRATPAPEAPKMGVVADANPLGKQIYEGACASCHSWSGAGPLTPYATLTGNRTVNDPKAINVAQIVIAGHQAAGRTRPRLHARLRSFLFGCRDRGGRQLCDRPLRGPALGADGGDVADLRRMN